MATEQDTSTPEATLRPQTPAARARNPEANRERTPEERERLRAESRARRKARADGKVVAPEPPAEEITLRRLSVDEREALAPPDAPQPRAAESGTPGANSSGHDGASARHDGASARHNGASARHAGRRPHGPRAARARSRGRRSGAGRRPLARLPPSSPLPRPAAAPPIAHRPHRRPPRPPRPPSGRPSVPPSPPFPRPRASAPRSCSASRRRSASSSRLPPSIGSGSLPGFGGGGLRAQATAHVVAPGGWLTLSGEHAPGDTKLLLESRGRGENWHSFGEGSSDGDGAFAVKGRVLERPGRVQVRARVPGAATTTP